MRNLDLVGGAEIVTEDDCWTLLRAAEYGRLVVERDRRPDVFPVNFDVVGPTVIIQTNMGHKLLAALAGSVAFEADEVDRAAGVAWSVVIHGRAVDVSDEPPPAGIRVPYVGPKAYRLRIEPDTITGRKFRLLDA